MRVDLLPRVRCHFPVILALGKIVEASWRLPDLAGICSFSRDSGPMVLGNGISRGYFYAQVANVRQASAYAKLLETMSAAYKK